jgi:hypothetical protein
MKRKFGMYSVLAITAVGLLGSVVPASASVSGRRNSALALSGVAVYELARGHTAADLVLGAGSYYAWQRVHHHRHVARRHHYRHVARHHGYFRHHGYA